MDNIEIIIITTIAIFLILFFIIRKNNIDEILNELSNDYKLIMSGGGYFSYPILTGSFNKIKLEVTVYNEDKTNYINFQFQFKNELYSHMYFSITEETFFSGIKSQLGFKDFEIGEENFDSTFLLKTGYSPFLMALLTKKNRSIITRIKNNSSKFVFENNILTTAIQPNKSDLRRFKKHISAIVLMLEYISNIKDLNKQLIENVKNETNKKIQLLNMQLLVKHYNDSSTNKFCKEIIENNKNFDLKLIAFQNLQEEEKNLYIISLLHDRKLKKDDLIKVVKLIKDNISSSLLKPLKKIFTSTRFDDVKSEILTMFKLYNNPDLANFLLTEISNNSTEINLRILHVLSSIGDRTTLLALRKLSFNEKSLIQAYKHTTSQIENRLGSQEDGGMSFVDNNHKEGTISISNDSTNGAISLNNKDKSS